MDGTPLIYETEEETIVRQSPAPKKRKTFLWMALGLLAFLIGSVMIAGFLIYKFSQRIENSPVKRQEKANISPTPAPSNTPLQTPSPVTTESSPVTETSPQTEESKPIQNNEESEEIIPIGWDTTATGFKGGDGKTYKFQCPPEGTAHIVWGSDIYTLDSSICTTAVHAGLFTLESGGVVTIEYRPGRQIYGSTVRNGIKSNTYGEYPHSFVVR